MSPWPRPIFPAARTLRAVAPAILLFLAASACRTPVREFAPPVALPDSFTLTGHEPRAEHWWEDFQDPALNALQAEALSDNFTLRAAWQRLRQADAAARIAGADLFPQADASAGLAHRWRRVLVTRTERRPAPAAGGRADTDDQSAGDDAMDDADADNSPAASPGAAAQRDSRTSWEIEHSPNRSLGLAVSYELDLWGRIRSLRNAAELEALASRNDLHTLAITLTAEVALAWYDLRAQQARLALLDEQTETARIILELIEARFRLGQARATDVLQQRQLVESLLGAREQVLAVVGLLQNQLAVLLGDVPGQVAFDAPPDLIDLPPLPQTGIPAEWVRARPDVRAAYRDLQAADQQLAAAIADRFPRVTLAAALEAASPDWNAVLDNWVATLAANLVAPIMDGVRRRAEIDRRRALVAERLEQYAQAILLAVREVEDALTREARQRAFLASLERQIETAGQVLERTRFEYLRGAQDYLRVLDAQQTLYDLQADRIAARSQLIEHRIQLCRALAGGWRLEPPDALQTVESNQRDNPPPPPTPTWERVPLPPPDPPPAAGA
ncbi:MAG TPA: TolC family protein [Candidatus Sumerlaeota bacterium]|nr:TolC family protein [Candidatus Sumerlaeota bacterium]